ncbi:MAG: DUF2062 domain-containing protein [Desulfatiglandales bacterium]
MIKKEGIKDPARQIRTVPKRKRIRHILKQLMNEHDSPRRLSLAIGIGIFIGTLPFYGVHIWLGLLVAVIARFNKLAIILGTQISMPWFAPFLIAGSIEIGELVLYGQFLKIDIPSFQSENFVPFLFPLLYSWLIGSLILGTLLAFISYGLSLFFIKKWRRLRVKDTMHPQIDSEVP